MDFIISAVAFLIIFSAIILIHEFGHFWVARKVGIKVEEFGIGLPPRIWGKKIKGTIYSINWIPFGGFVRLYGEDGIDPKLMKDDKSFVSKPLRKRMAVVIAGVFMNFILAFSLLTIGFSIGIEPLIVSPSDVLNAINDEIIEIDHGARIKSVEEGSGAYEAGLKVDDIIVEINGSHIYDTEKQFAILKNPTEEDIFLQIYRDGELNDIRIDSRRDIEDLGLDIYDVIFLPRVVVRDVLVESDSASAGLQAGDVIITMNDKPIYNVTDYQTLINSENKIEFKIVRNNELFSVSVSYSENQRVVIINVNPDAPAFLAGFQKGDIILEIEGMEIYSPEEAIEVTTANPEKELKYLIDRNGEQFEINVKPAQDGLIGVGLITMISYKNNQLSVYNTDFITSVKGINDVQYPVHIAVGEALKECGRLAILTVGMFGNLARSVVSQLAIPEGVAGPVGIARLTHVFVQEGLLALLRFTALLSLSLAVLNIIPFPALDGGRLLFLLIEAIRGKRIPARWESAIHALGFVLLIGLIFLVTYSDILNFFL